MDQTRVIEKQTHQFDSSYYLTFKSHNIYCFFYLLLYMCNCRVQNNNGEISADECEREAAWLRAVGMGTAVEKYEKGEFIDGSSVKQQLSFLTRQQRATVQKRVETLNRSVSCESLHWSKFTLSHMSGV